MSLQIICDNISKNFSNQKIITDFNYTFQSSETYAVLGANGVGKSTLMKIIAGYLNASSGSIKLFNSEKLIPNDKHFPFISFSAPYMELIEEFTLEELIDFHLKFKKFKPFFSESDIPSVLLDTKQKKKQISTFSSGMKQRLKLVLALFTDTPIILLDEPTTNLDAAGIEWYRAMIEKYVLSAEGILIVASNTETDYFFCKNRIQLGG